MEKMKGPVDTLCSSVADLLDAVTKAASDGDIVSSGSYMVFSLI